MMKFSQSKGLQFIILYMMDKFSQSVKRLTEVKTIYYLFIYYLLLYRAISVFLNKYTSFLFSRYGNRETQR